MQTFEHGKDYSCEPSAVLTTVWQMLAAYTINIHAEYVIIKCSQSLMQFAASQSYYVRLSRLTGLTLQDSVEVGSGGCGCMYSCGDCGIMYRKQQQSWTAEGCQVMAVSDMNHMKRKCNIMEPSCWKQRTVATTQPKVMMVDAQCQMLCQQCVHYPVCNVPDVDRYNVK